MCGIVGLASKTSIAHRAWLAAGRDAMTHRGPDDAGEWWSGDGRVGLGHRRLSIIDLSPAWHQPMSDDSRALTIVFNGEIYNFTELRTESVAKGHVFRSHSDTEVILAAYREWGTDCLSCLNGMFAIAFYDGQWQTFFWQLVRVWSCSTTRASTQAPGSRCRLYRNLSLIQSAVKRMGTLGHIRYVCSNV